MLNYKNLIVFTGGNGRFAKIFKTKENDTKFSFLFPKKKELNILKSNTVLRYLKKKRPKY